MQNLEWDESFGIGSDTITGINDADDLPPFMLTVELNKLTIRIDRPQFLPDDIRRLAASMNTAALGIQ
jgi:hypothetical protein